MSNIYKMIEIVGTSKLSIEDAIQQAINRSSQTLEGLEWFEVTQTRGHVENGKITKFQVVLKVGFSLKE